MISVEEAKEILNSHIADFGIEKVPLNASLGRVLREEIVADRDFPPYDRITMDGIAISFEKWKAGKRTFKISGVAPAGAPKTHVENPENCIEVMTGAIMPDGVDTMIPYELIEENDGNATITTEKVVQRQNIHFKGQDRKQGDVILEPGITISTAEVGVCATVGKSEILVSKLPKVIVISSGDELVEINQKPEAHQIRKSNVNLLEAGIKDLHCEVDVAHLNDDYNEIVNALKNYVEDYQIIILSGGVSKGKFDYFPKALEDVGVKKHFHKILQRPGKPFWFGSIENKVTVYAFPGNPVSSFMCFQAYFKPWLEKCLHSNESTQPKAILSRDVEFMPDLTYYLEVEISYSEKGELLANPIRGNGSGDFANLVDADAFIVLPRGKNTYSKGEVYPIIFYR